MRTRPTWIGGDQLENPQGNSIAAAAVSTISEPIVRVRLVDFAHAKHHQTRGAGAQEVMRDWKLAKAWLLRELAPEQGKKTS